MYVWALDFMYAVLILFYDVPLSLCDKNVYILWIIDRRAFILGMYNSFRWCKLLSNLTFDVLQGQVVADAVHYNLLHFIVLL